jgi:hypothetical protein
MPTEPIRFRKQPEEDLGVQEKPHASAFKSIENISVERRVEVFWNGETTAIDAEGTWRSRGQRDETSCRFAAARDDDLLASSDGV